MEEAYQQVVALGCQSDVVSERNVLLCKVFLVPDVKD
jgi:hypothetical protein